MWSSLERRPALLRQGPREPYICPFFNFFLIGLHPSSLSPQHSPLTITAWTLMWRHALSMNPLVRELAGLDPLPEEETADRKDR